MPLKAYPPFVIYSDTVLPLAVSTQRLEAVAGQTHESFELVSGIKNSEAFFRLSSERLKFSDPLPFMQVLCILVFEVLYHVLIIPLVRMTSKVFSVEIETDPGHYAREILTEQLEKAR